MPDFFTSERSILLTREASLSAVALGQGLTLLRKYAFTQTEFFHASLLFLADGLKRLLKLIFVYAYRLRYDQYPRDKNLRDYENDLSRLFTTSLDISEKFGYDDITDFYRRDVLYRRIISILSDFAVQTSFFNLDMLTDGEQTGVMGPLTRWEKEINALIIERHVRVRPHERNATNRLFGTDFLENCSVVYGISEDGTEISSLSEAVQQTMLSSTKQKYSMYYVYVLVRYLAELLGLLEAEGRFYPYLREFFMVFLNDNRDAILRKKSWNPFPPYHF